MLELSPLCVMELNYSSPSSSYVTASLPQTPATVMCHYDHCNSRGQLHTPFTQSPSHSRKPAQPENCWYNYRSDCNYIDFNSVPETYLAADGIPVTQSWNTCYANHCLDSSDLHHFSRSSTPEVTSPRTPSEYRIRASLIMSSPDQNPFVKAPSERSAVIYAAKSQQFHSRHTNKLTKTQTSSNCGSLPGRMLPYSEGSYPSSTSNTGDVINSDSSLPWLEGYGIQQYPDMLLARITPDFEAPRHVSIAANDFYDFPLPELQSQCTIAFHGDDHEQDRSNWMRELKPNNFAGLEQAAVETMDPAVHTLHAVNANNVCAVYSRSKSSYDYANGEVVQEHPVIPDLHASWHMSTPQNNDMQRLLQDHHDQTTKVSAGYELSIADLFKDSEIPLSWNLPSPTASVLWRDPEEVVSACEQKLGQRDTSKDNILLECRDKNMSYKEIKQKYGFAEAESTLRGRYRTLSKPKEARVRKPEWSNTDIRMLFYFVHKLARKEGVSSSAFRLVGNLRVITSEQALRKIPWKEVASGMEKHGGTYKYGNATVKKKYLEVCEEKLGYRLNNVSVAVS